MVNQQQLGQGGREAKSVKARLLKHRHSYNYLNNKYNFNLRDPLRRRK